MVEASSYPRLISEVPIFSSRLVSSLFLSLSLSFSLGSLSFTSISHVFLFLFFLSEARGTRVVSSFYRQECCCGKKSTKGQTLSSSIQRRHGKSCKMKTLCYFFKNSGIDSVLCHMFSFFGHRLSLALSVSLCL